MSKKEDKKNDIIKKSYHLMHLYGYNGTSVKNITDAAKIPKGSFYNYFKDKEDYAKQAIQYFSNHEEYIQMLDDCNYEPKIRIINLFTEKIKDFKNDEIKCGCFIGNLTQEMGLVSEVIAEETESFHQELTEKMESCLAKDDMFQENQSLNAIAMASFIVNAWQGSLLRMKSKNNFQPLENFLDVLKLILK